MSKQRFMKWYFIVPAVLVAAPVFIALFVTVAGGIVMLLWNWLLPPLFGFPQVTLLQGFGLLALGRILFGGFGGGGHRPKRMTPAERERMRGLMSGRSCRTSSDGGAATEQAIDSLRPRP